MIHLVDSGPFINYPYSNIDKEPCGPLVSGADYNHRFNHICGLQVAVPDHLVYRGLGVYHHPVPCDHYQVITLVFGTALTEYPGGRITEPTLPTHDADLVDLDGRVLGEIMNVRTHLFHHIAQIHISAMTWREWTQYCNAVKAFLVIPTVTPLDHRLARLTLGHIL